MSNLKNPNPVQIKTRQVQAYEMGVCPTSGVRLWAYTHTILEINKMFNSKKWIPVGNLCNFFATKAIVNHHTKNGNLEFKPESKGFVRLTPKGSNYFLARINGMNTSQKIDKKSLDDARDLILGSAKPNRTRPITIMAID